MKVYVQYLLRCANVARVRHGWIADMRAAEVGFATFVGDALPPDLGILAPVGITLDPAVGAVLMSLSTIIVSINAQPLCGLDLTTA
jgi:hypothetical protein